MPRRGLPGGQGRSRAARNAKTAAGVVLGGLLVICLAAVGYEIHGHRAEIKQFFSNPPPPDPVLVDTAIDEAYTRLAPTKITKSQATIGSRDVRQDRVLLPKTGSLLRANAEITAAVERAGGEVAYGIESGDDKGRKTGVTLGVSVRKNLVREIKLERSTR
jgi:hypothetical protein